MLNPATIITLSTLRLVCTSSIGTSTGTGFLFEFQSGSSYRQQVIITNKHVVGQSSILETLVTIIPKGARGLLRDDNLTENLDHKPVRIDHLQDRIIRHPDDNVDLCCILFSDILSRNSQIGDLRHVALSEKWFPDTEKRKFLRPIEPIVMIGYPNGLWDETNNLPIARDGLTGSHPLICWNGKQEFVVDAACFPGSSGSPVFLFEDGIHRTRANAMTSGTSISFIGVLWGGPLYTVEGRIEQRPVPTGMNDVPVMNSMMNLGFVIHADAILALKRKMEDLIPASLRDSFLG